MTQDARSSITERHVQTAIAFIMTAVMGWVGLTTSDTAVEVAVLSAQIVALQEQVRELRDGTKDRYTRADALRDFAVRDDVLGGVLSRLDRLEDNVFLGVHE